VYQRTFLTTASSVGSSPSRLETFLLQRNVNTPHNRPMRNASYGSWRNVVLLLIVAGGTSSRTAIRVGFAAAFVNRLLTIAQLFIEKQERARWLRERGGSTAS